MGRTTINFSPSELDALWDKAAAIESGLRCLSGLLSNLGVLATGSESARLMGLANLLNMQADAVATLLTPLDSFAPHPTVQDAQPEVGHVC
ncbi:MAG: hypothetical protein AB7E32_09215 [Desulfovibrio sp.]